MRSSADTTGTIGRCPGHQDHDDGQRDRAEVLADELGLDREADEQEQQRVGDEAERLPHLLERLADVRRRLCSGRSRDHDAGADARHDARRSPRTSSARTKLP
jgi:hypothetical protein